MKKMTGWALIVFLTLTLVCALASCKGVNRGEGYVFLWSENANYARITISDREYIHFHRDSGVGEWVVDGESSPITIGGIYHPIRDADAYRLTRYNTESEAELAKIFLHLDVSEDVATESFYLHNPDRKRGVIHIVHEATEKIIYASRIETSYQEHISFSFTSPQWKVFLHDDGSTDGTQGILEVYEKQHPGRVRLIDGPPTGSAKDNFWYLLSRVEADVYFFCDQDDIWLPDKVEKSIKRLEAMPGERRLVFCDMKVVDEDGGVIDGSFLHYNGRDPGALRYPRILIDNPAAGTTICMDRGLRDAALSVSFDLSGVEMHDGFLAAIAALTGSLSYLEEPLVLYRQHAGNAMGAAKSETVLERILRNLGDIVTGRFAANKREFIALSRNAAGQLLRLPMIKDKDRRILKTYANLDRLPKWRRIRFMRRYGFNRARHTWWLYLLS